MFPATNIFHLFLCWLISSLQTSEIVVFATFVFCTVQEPCVGIHTQHTIKAIKFNVVLKSLSFSSLHVHNRLSK